MQKQVNTLELGKEYLLPDEEEAIEEITRISIELLELDNQDKSPVRRGQHAKHHGCVKGEFMIEANLPEKIRFGVFREPRSYPAWIRFSNASGNADQPDSKGDARGMAIKLMGVDGEKILEAEKDEQTQDFVMIDHPVFVIRNLQDYVEFFKKRLEAKGKAPLNFFFPSLNPLKWRLHEFRIGRAIRSKKVVSPLEIEYWSTTPFKLGSAAVKFSVKPSPDNISGRKATNSDNYLREAMIEHLNSKEAHFDFLVQFQSDPDKTPVEDPTIEWDEQQAPSLKVATIKIPSQKFDSIEQMQFCENLSYTPWHSLLEHRPLGGINRARKQVYDTVSAVRHDRNKQPIQEPTGQEVFPTYS